MRTVCVYSYFAKQKSIFSVLFFSVFISECSILELDLPMSFTEI